MGARFRASVNPRIRGLKKLFELDKEAVEAATVAVDTHLRDHENKVFSSEGAAGGDPWPPLSTRYAKWKRRRVGSKKILVFTGEMRKSLTTKKHPDHISDFARLSNSRWLIRFGTWSKIARYHRDGGTTGLPQRNPLPITSQQARELEGKIQVALAPYLRRALRAINAGARLRAKGRGVLDE